VDLAPTLESLHTEVDAVLDWLQAHRYLSEERFVESRIHARSSRFGNLRIRQELQQHGLTLSPELTAGLRHSEHERASEVRQRKFGDSPATSVERARQARFLAGRGFSADVIWRVLRQLGAAGASED
jgi:regulatory protein